MDKGHLLRVKKLRTINIFTRVHSAEYAAYRKYVACIWTKQFSIFSQQIPNSIAHSRQSCM